MQHMAKDNEGGGPGDRSQGSDAVVSGEGVTSAAEPEGQDGNMM